MTQTETQERTLKETEIEALDLDKYVRKIAARDPEKWTAEELALMAQEYRRFLLLRLNHPHHSLVPTELMDALWHEHILDTRTYAVDMEHLFGAFVHHEPAYEPDETTKARMEALQEGTAMLYEATFGEPMAGLVARCAGKKCHVPESCRCR